MGIKVVENKTFVKWTTTSCINIL